MENFQKANVHYHKTFNGWNGHKLCFSLSEVRFYLSGSVYVAESASYLFPVWKMSLEYFFSRHFKLEQSLSEFEKDPRGKPTFTQVFILQEKTVSIVGIAVFVHTVYLIQILSSINHVYGEFIQYESYWNGQILDKNSVFPLLMKIIRSPLVHLMTSVIIPLQIAISIGGVLLFSANSEMLRDFFSFFKVVLWQGYLSQGFNSTLWR